MRIICTCFFLILLTLGCNVEYNFWDIDSFNMDSSALKDKEGIMMIYASRGPKNKPEFNFYYHYIVVSQVTGDTVNVLSVLNTKLVKSDGNKVFNFYKEGNETIKMLSNSGNNSFNKIGLEDIKKVVGDPKHDFISKNNYPTIIGVIGYLDAQGIMKLEID